MSTEDLSYFQEEEFKKNLALYEQMLKGGQSAYLEADELTDIAEYYLVQNETEKTMDCISYALKLHPGSVDPLIFLARQKMFEGDIEGAKTIKDCITDQNDREVIFLHAELLLREHKERMAHEYLLEKKEHEEEDLALYIYDSATLFLDYGYLDLASQWGKYALEMEPENEKFLQLKADILLFSDRPEEAIAILDHLLDLDPYNANAWHSLGEAYFTSEKFQKAKETADFALAIDEHDAQAILLKANCQLQLQNFEEAHRLYLRYFQENKSNDLPYLFDGVCLSALGRYEEALSQLQEAENLSGGDSPEQQHIYANLSDVYSKLGKPDIAIRYIEKIKDIVPNYSTNLYKGHILLENGKIKEGLAYYDSYIQANEKPKDAHFFVGVSLMENGFYTEAWEHFLYVLGQMNSSHDEADRKIYSYLSYCALMQNRYQDFLSYLKIACEVDPDSLEYTVGRYIPEEVETKDFYRYVVSHSDLFSHFSPEHK